MFVWARQPRLRLDGAIAAVMALVLIRHWRLFSPGEWLFIVLSVLSFSSTDSAAPSVVRNMVGLYPVHLAFGQVCANRRAGRLLVALLAAGNLGLMVEWSHGGDVLV